MFKRFSKLGYPILHLSSYNLVHLDHRRGNDSKPNEHYDVNRSEFLKVNRMQAAELARYVEQELSITERDAPLRLAERRALYRRSYFVWLLKVKAFVALLSIQFRAHGGGALLTRLVKR